MTTLYKRANPRQRQILRIIEGAVRNVAHHHKDVALTDRTARSIAKRAAGTLTAQWPDVLALSREPDSHTVEPGALPYGPRKAKARHGSVGRGASHRRSPFPRLYKELSIWAGEAKRHSSEQYQTLVEVLRLIDKIEKENRGG